MSPSSRNATWSMRAAICASRSVDDGGVSVISPRVAEGSNWTGRDESGDSQRAHPGGRPCASCGSVCWSSRIGVACLSLPALLRRGCGLVSSRSPTHPSAMTGTTRPISL
jgi:hypothetical protein